VILDDELIKLSETAVEEARYEDAARLFRKLIEAPSFPEFLTLPAYDLITTRVGQSPSPPLAAEITPDQGTRRLQARASEDRIIYSPIHRLRRSI
jgi:hypothetical protein